MRKHSLLTIFLLSILGTMTANAQPEYVDLGLPSGTLWATTNIGATSPEEYGDYFAWGGTTTKSNYSEETYFDIDDDFSFKKYYNDGGLTELLPEDDAATANWGSEWQMPSDDQIDELYNNSYTTAEWTTQNGVNGYKITSKSNGKSIFLPAAGFRAGTSLYDAGYNGYYWSRSLGTGNYSNYAYGLGFFSNNIYGYGYYRLHGRSVRPVHVKEHEYVDLGLPSGTLWATTNIGATSPEEYGDYFAWGETKPKSDYSWETYKWCNGSETTLTKYCTDSEYGDNGFTDGLTELQPEDDAATANWGSKWQMPSMEQFQELINSEYTTAEWTTQNDVYGYKITSINNGNSIFLPAAGYHYDSSLYNAGSYGLYRSSNNNGLNDDIGNVLFFNSDEISIYYFVTSALGTSVRPVRTIEKQVYTEFVEETGTLTYYYDSQMASRTGITELYDPVGNPDAVRFTGYYKKVTKAVIDPSMKDAPLTSMYSMFFGGINNETFAFQALWKMTEIKGMENLNTADVTSMDYMFEACNALQTVDVNSFDISKVTQMDFMFGDCYELTTIYCSKDWSITSASSDNMFGACRKLVGGNGTAFDSNVTNATYARPDGGTASPGYFTAGVVGDVNGDKVVNFTDAQSILTLMANENYESSADVNNDDAVNFTDYQSILTIMAQ